LDIEFPLEKTAGDDVTRLGDFVTVWATFDGRFFLLLGQNGRF